jgi:DNA-binding transcriptional LysR family regulator
MNDEEMRQFEQWCRKVLPEMGRFRAACVLKNRRRAGATLGVEGPNIGRSIDDLDELLRGWLDDGSLIDRHETRQVIPTEAGEELLRYCEKLAELRAEVLANLDRLQRGSQIRVAMTHSAFIAYFSALESTYKTRRADGTLDYGRKFFSQDKVWTEIEREVLEGQADVGIYSFPPSRRREIDPNLTVQNWVQEEIVLVLPESVNNPKGDTISLNDLPLLPKIVHYDRSLRFDRTDTIEKYLRKHGALRRFKDNWLLGVGSIAEIKETLKRHKEFMSFLPWPTVQEEHQDRSLRAYRLNPPMRPRLMHTVCRLHCGRRAVADFLRAAAALQGPRNFDPTVRGQIAQ